MREVYLDYSATTPVKDEVINEMMPFFKEAYGNPSSLYAPGLRAKEGLSRARQQVADIIGADPKEIFFTSCGTEADNWVLEGVVDALKEKGNHIITTRIEHHAIIHTCMYLQKYHGVEVTYLDVDEEGFVDPEDLRSSIKDDTILVSIMMINNEIGTLEPIKELAAIAKERGVFFHTDAVQAVGNVRIDVNDLGIDFLSMSAHKIYGPKGIGALYKRKGINLPSFVHGGAQENRKRAGTENTAGIVGFGKAAELANVNLDEHIAHSRELRQYLWDRINEKIDKVRLNGPRDFNKRHPGNLNVSFSYIEGESILLLMDAAGVAVSTGSACSSGSLDISHVLSSTQVPMEIINGTVRFTVGDFTTREDIDYAVDALAKVVDTLRRVSPVTGKEGW